MTIRQRIRLEQAAPIAMLLIAGGFWEWLARRGMIAVLFFPAPTTIAATLGQWFVSGALMPHLFATVTRIGLGGLAGSVLGLGFGLLMGWSPRLRRMLDPLIAAAHPLPKIAMLPLVMILFGIGETSKIVLIAVSAFFPMLINTATGVRQIPSLYFDVAHNYRASVWLTFRRVIIPGSLPMILTGLRLAANMAFVITLSVEIVTAQKGLGAIIWLAWETLRTEELYAALTVIALLGVSINGSIKILTAWLLPWQELSQRENA